MGRNNLLVLFGQILLSLLLFGVLAVSKAHPAWQVQILQGGGRFLLVAFILFYYWLFAKLLGVTPWWMSPFSTIGLPLLGGSLLGIAYLAEGLEVFSQGVGASLWRFPYDVLMLPESLVLGLFGHGMNLQTLILMPLAPWLFFTLGAGTVHVRRIRRARRRRRQWEK